MDTRYIRPARYRSRGAVRPVVVAVIAVFALLGLGAWLLIFKPHQALMKADDARGGAGTSAPLSNEPAPSNVQAMSLNQLLAEARKAMNGQRLLAPAGNNAFEFYLKALERQPGNQVAADALRETFPFGATAAEQEINQRDFVEAQRQIDLLARADPSNYTLTILRSKLDAQRKLLDREQQQALDQQKQQQLAVAKQQEAARVAEAASKQRNDQQTQQLVAQQAQAARLAQQQADAKSAPPKPTAAPAATDPVLLQQYSPRYPTPAMRASQEGWVELEFTVAADGSVADVHVLDSQPHHVFDRAAIDAVSRWKFQPGTQAGEPHAVKLQRRIQFKLNQ